MPKFQVTVGRDRTEYTTVEVEADAPWQAKEKALMGVKHNDRLMEWNLDRESIIGEAYVSGEPIEMETE